MLAREARRVWTAPASLPILPVVTEQQRALVERVKKLLALAGSSNPHEAAAAAARAQALVVEHRLEGWLIPARAAEAEADPITDGLEAPLETARRIRKFKRVLASALAEANGSVAWVAVRAGQEALCVVGRAHDRAVISALYEGLRQWIEWASATAGPRRGRAWHEAFRIGVVDVIVPRLRSAELDARGAVSPHALVRVDQASAAHREALDRFVSERLGLSRGRALRVDARAYERGRAAGARMPLPPPFGPRVR